MWVRVIVLRFFDFASRACFSGFMNKHRRNPKRREHHGCRQKKVQTRIKPREGLALKENASARLFDPIGPSDLEDYSNLS